jgi:hypothetical protein
MDQEVLLIHKIQEKDRGIRNNPIKKEDKKVKEHHNKIFEYLL